MRRAIPVIEHSYVRECHLELDALTEALGDTDAEETWTMITNRVEGLSCRKTREHLSVLLVLALQRVKEMKERENGRS